MSDGATFDVDAQPEEVHFLRSPSGALYLPDCEESGDGWKGWAKYMIYKLPASPSPLTLTSDQTEQEQQTSRSATPFTLKFRVVQTEKCCQTDSRLSINPGICFFLSYFLNIGFSKYLFIFFISLADKLPSVTPRAIYPFSASLTTSHGLLDVGDVWKFDAEAVTKELKEDLKGEDELGGRDENEEKELISGKEEEMDGLLNEVWNVATTLNHDGDDEELVDGSIISPSGDVLETAVDIDQVPDVKVVMVPAETVPVTTAPVEEDVNECNLDELWDPFVDESGRVDQVDVCEWIPQSYGLTDDGCEQWADPDALAESWPPPNIPVEYLDDEFFEEIYGSLDSMKASETASGAGKNSRRRRRRTSQKHQTVRRPKRPCSFFVEGECRRPDCKFSHDLGSIPCRFWIESSCFKGIFVLLVLRKFIGIHTFFLSFAIQAKNVHFYMVYQCPTIRAIGTAAAQMPNCRKAVVPRMLWNCRISLAVLVNPVMAVRSSSSIWKPTSHRFRRLRSTTKPVTRNQPVPGPVRWSVSLVPSPSRKGLLPLTTLQLQPDRPWRMEQVNCWSTVD